MFLSFEFQVTESRFRVSRDNGGHWDKLAIKIHRIQASFLIDIQLLTESSHMLDFDCSMWKMSSHSVWESIFCEKWCHRWQCWRWQSGIKTTATLVIKPNEIMKPLKYSKRISRSSGPIPRQVWETEAAMQLWWSNTFGLLLYCLWSTKNWIQELALQESSQEILRSPSAPTTLAVGTNDEICFKAGTDSSEEQLQQLLTKAMAVSTHERYTVEHANKWKEPREFARVIIEASIAAWLLLLNQLTMVRNGLDAEFKKDIDLPLETAKLEQFSFRSGIEEGSMVGTRGQDTYTSVWRYVSL